MKPIMETAKSKGLESVEKIRSCIYLFVCLHNMLKFSIVSYCKSYNLNCSVMVL